jgi:SAM-dependent methyltransferase
MFTKSTEYYDAIFGAKGKDYVDESKKLRAIIRKYKRSAGNTMLDVACGNGNHIKYLKDEFAITGIDLDPNMIDMARKRYPAVEFHEGSMVDFSLKTTFDIVMCLTSAIGYAKTAEGMRSAIRTMSGHVKPGGVLIVEPWISLEEYRPGAVFAVFVDKPDLKITRMNVNELRGNVSVLNFHYLVGHPGGVDYFTECHEMGLFSHEEYSAAFASCGLTTTFEKEGLIERGIYIGLKNH